MFFLNLYDDQTNRESDKFDATHNEEIIRMSTLSLLGIGAGSIALLLLLIIRWQVHAFVAMMLVSV